MSHSCAPRTLVKSFLPCPAMTGARSVRESTKCGVRAAISANRRSLGAVAGFVNAVCQESRYSQCVRLR